MPAIALQHPELSPDAAAAAAKVSPEIKELIRRSGKKPAREYTLGERSEERRVGKECRY